MSTVFLRWKNEMLVSKKPFLSNTGTPAVSSMFLELFSAFVKLACVVKKMFIYGLILL